ncbi:MAG: hypothetical protein ACT4OZ_10420 [Gemmatimonadota bacterium]
MLLGAVRPGLTRNDAQLVIRLLAREGRGGESQLEQRLADDGLDALLDDPFLAAALLRQDSATFASLPLFLYVLVRRALLEDHETDRTVADFVASILLHFGMQRRAFRIRDHDEVEYHSLASLAMDADSADPHRAFLSLAHMGNLSLWLAGIFPDHISARNRRGGPDMGYYDEMGRRGYQLAAQHRLAAQYGASTLLETVAERFPRLRCSLNRLSDNVVFRHHHSVDRLLRQVWDAERWRQQGESTGRD